MPYVRRKQQQTTYTISVRVSDEEKDETVGPSATHTVGLSQLKRVLLSGSHSQCVSIFEIHTVPLSSREFCKKKTYKNRQLGCYLSK